MTERQPIHTDSAPAAIGPYSQALKIKDLIFVSGQLPIDPESGEIVPGDIRIQTRMALSNLESILKAAGVSMDRVVKTMLFITDMDTFPEVNEVYSEFFPNQPPARSCVEVSRLPKHADIEIEAIAVD